MKTHNFTFALNKWSLLTCKVEEQSLTIQDKKVRFILPTIIERIYNKRKRRLTTRQRRRDMLA